jgi:hypothetical protein
MSAIHGKLCAARTVGKVPVSASTACFATRCRESGTIFIPLNTVALGAPKAAVDPPAEVETELEVLLLELKLLAALEEDLWDEEDLNEDEDLEEEDWKDELLDVDKLEDDTADELDEDNEAAKLDADEILEETITAELACEAGWLEIVWDELASDEGLFVFEPPDPPQADSNKISGSNKLILR